MLRISQIITHESQTKRSTVRRQKIPVIYIMKSNSDNDSISTHGDAGQSKPKNINQFICHGAPLTKNIAHAGPQFFAA